MRPATPSWKNQLKRLGFAGKKSSRRSQNRKPQLETLTQRQLLAADLELGSVELLTNPLTVTSNQQLEYQRATTIAQTQSLQLEKPVLKARAVEHNVQMISSDDFEWGPGSGAGDGDASADANGEDAEHFESQFGSGLGAGDETGSGSGAGDETGSGSGAGDETGSGSGAGDETGSGSGTGDGSGSGSGDDGSGSGWGYDDEFSGDGGGGDRCELPEDAGSGFGSASLDSGNLTLGSNGAACSSQSNSSSYPVYHSDQNPHPIIAVTHTLSDTSPVADQITAELSFGGLTPVTVYYDTTGLSPGEDVRIVMQVDATLLSTGRHSWQIEVVEGDAANPPTQIYDGHRAVFNRIDSEFGNRVWLDELDQLFVDPGGATLIRGDGTSGWFEATPAVFEGDQMIEPAGFASPPGSFAELQENSDGTYTLSRRWGDSDHFDADGLLTANVDRYGNETTYQFTDADNDGNVDELASVIDPFSRQTDYQYFGGLLQSVTDPAGRVTTYQYDTNRFLTSVTRPDPDGPGPLAAPVTTYQHDTAGRVTKMTDPAGGVTDYTHDFAGRLSDVIRDGETWSLSARQVQGLVNLSVTGYDAANKASVSHLLAEPVATVTNELGHQTSKQLDRFGYATEQTDADGNQWTYERNRRGQVTKATGPDPDGTGPLTAPETSFQYDTAGNVTQITYPDGGSETRSYDTQWNRLISETDPLGRQTVYELDSNSGDVLEVRQIVGLDDRNSSESDDAVTSFTYTDNSGVLPAGLPLSQTDPLGRITQFAYQTDSAADDFGRLAAITVAAGTAVAATTTFTHDAAGNRISTTDPLGRTTTHAYDNLDRLIQTTLPDPDGPGPRTAPVTTFAYDPLGNLTRQTDALGRQTQFSYDTRGNIVTITRPDHNNDGNPTINTFTYDAAGRLASETDPRGGVTDYVYDKQGRVTTITRPDPDGTGPLTAPVWSYIYNAHGLLTSETDPLGNTTEYSYDSVGRRSTTLFADPDGSGPLARPQTAIAYDLAGQPVTSTDPLGRQTTFTYDALGRLETFTLPDPDDSGPLSAPVQSRQYDLVGNLIAETDPLGNTNQYTFDAQNRLTSLQQPDPDGSGPLAAPLTSFAYDATGQRTSITDPLGRVTSFTYNALGELIRQTLPDPDDAGPEIAPLTDFEYDAVGNLLSQQDALGHVTSYAYNELDWRITTTDPNQDVTSFAYDDAGNLTALTDAAGNTTSWVYDGLSRNTQETNELAKTRYFQYDAVGNLIARTDRNGRVTEYDYDNLYQPIAERWLAANNSPLRTLTYSYDVAGQLTAASDPNATYHFSYDGLGRTTAITHDLSMLTAAVTMGQSFDAAGNRTQLAAAIGSNDDFVTAYSYNSLHQMRKINQQGVSGGNAVAEKRIELTYNAAGQFDSLTRYADIQATQMVAVTDYAYDMTGRLTDLTHSKGSTTLADYDWSYDEANRTTQFVSLSDGIADYTYDDASQFTASDYDYQTDEAYTYDANGNRTNTGVVTGVDNQLLSDGIYNYEYDDEGNRTKKTEIATGNFTEYGWDHRNRLTHVHRNSVGTALQTLHYSYDIFDRRIGKSDVVQIGPTYSESYVYDGDHVALKFEGGQLANRYLHGPIIDQILADEQVDSLTTPGEVLWPLTDNLGTVRDLASHDGSTDVTSIENHIRYDGFGNRTSETNAAIDHLFGYTGREWDDAVDLQYNRARWYDPATGRWLSNDPIGFKAGDANLYRYVGNQPTTLTDPSGLQPPQTYDEPPDELPDGLKVDDEDLAESIEEEQRQRRKKRPPSTVNPESGPLKNPELGGSLPEDWEGEKRPKDVSINSDGKSRQRGEQTRVGRGRPPRGGGKLFKCLGPLGLIIGIGQEILEIYDNGGLPESKPGDVIIMPGGGPYIVPEPKGSIQRA